MVFSVIGPFIVAFTVLFTFSPCADESLAIWIVKYTLTRALVILKFANINLTAWPVVSTFAILSASLKQTIE
jgi:hypothetical protein